MQCVYGVKYIDLVSLPLDQVRPLSATLFALQSQVIDLEVQLGQALMASEASSAGLSSNMSQLEMAGSQLRDAKARIAELEHCNAQQQEEMAQLEMHDGEELHRAHATVASLEQALQDARVLEATLRTQLQSATDSLDADSTKQASRIAAAAAQITKLQRSNTDLQVAHAGLQDANANLEADATRAGRQRQALEEDLADMQLRAASAEAALQDAQALPLSSPDMSNFLLYEVVSLHTCVLPYKYRNMLGHGMLHKFHNEVMGNNGNNGAQARNTTLQSDLRDARARLLDLTNMATTTQAAAAAYARQAEQQLAELDAKRAEVNALREASGIMQRDLLRAEADVAAANQAHALAADEARLLERSRLPPAVNPLLALMDEAEAALKKSQDDLQRERMRAGQPIPN